MAYVVIETQSDGDTASALHDVYTDRNDAENKYHTVLAYAAKSSVPIHSATMITDEGYFVKSERYIHEVAPESEETNE